jgi:hypothetical protein
MVDKAHEGTQVRGGDATWRFKSTTRGLTTIEIAVPAVAGPAACVPGARYSSPDAYAPTFEECDPEVTANG